MKSAFWLALALPSLLVPFPVSLRAHPLPIMKRFPALLALPALLLAGLLAPVATAAPQLGLQTWTCRGMTTFDQVVDFAVKHRITQIQFIAAHLDPLAPREESLRKKAILDAKGLKAYTFGVARTSLDKEENRKLFEFARLMGMTLIVVEPKNAAEWDNLEELVKEYNIRLAIHNHNLDTVYGDPAKVRALLAKRDRRIGVCLDVGWITAAGFDAAKVFRDYGDRVFDIHFKDKKIETAADGKRVPVDTEIGKGDSNYAGLIAEIKKSGWSGVMAIETDSRVFAEDPNQMVAEARRYFEARVAGR